MHADDHTLAITIPHKKDHTIAAAHLNADLAALREYGTYWSIKFVPLQAFPLVVSLKSDISNHSPLYLNTVCILEVSSVRVLGFIFDFLPYQVESYFELWEAMFGPIVMPSAFIWKLEHCHTS